MQDLTRELPFDIFLALLEKKDEGCAEDDEEEENYYSHKRSRYCYYDPPRKTNDDDTHVMTEIHDTTYAVKSLHALDGTTIAHEYDFDMESCLEEDPFLDLEIAEEDFEPYMGNSVCLFVISLLSIQEIEDPQLTHSHIHLYRALLPLTGIAVRRLLLSHIQSSEIT
jgi:hypothetical protein